MNRRMHTFTTATALKSLGDCCVRLRFFFSLYIFFFTLHCLGRRMQPPHAAFRPLSCQGCLSCNNLLWKRCPAALTCLYALVTDIGLRGGRTSVALHRGAGADPKREGELISCRLCERDTAQEGVQKPAAMDTAALAVAGCSFACLGSVHSRAVLFVCTLLCMLGF